MKKLAILLFLLPTFIYAQDNNNIGIGYHNNLLNNKKPQPFIDTIEVIVLLHHLDDFEPSESVTVKKVFMERKGDLVEYNMAKGNTLAYSPGWMKVPTETKIFYKTIRNKPILTPTLRIGEFIVEGDIYEKIEVIIPKSKILQVYNTDEND
jgi:hypothetical protein